jgi:antirestriction protein ArdC
VKSQSEIHRNVTEQIVEELKEGFLPPWRKTWSDDPNAQGLHTSLSTGNPYRGINQLVLQCSAIRGNFKSRWWGTYNQIRQNNSAVRKGQKGTHVILWKPICRKRVNENGKEIDESFPIMREFVVFNAEQTTGGL